MQASHCGVFSCCGAWTLRCLGFCSRGAQALLLWHVEFSWTRDETCVPCTGRQILNHWTTRKSTVSPRTVGREGEARAPEKGLGGPFFIPSCFSHELERPWCWSTKILFLIYMRRGLEMISKACFYSDMVGSQDQAFWSIEVGSNLLFIMTFFWIVWLQFGHPQRIKWHISALMELHGGFPWLHHSLPGTFLGNYYPLSMDHQFQVIWLLFLPWQRFFSCDVRHLWNNFGQTKNIFKVWIFH